MMKYCLIGFLLSFSLIVLGQSSAIQNAMKNYDFELAIQLINKEKKTPESEFLKARCYKNMSQYKQACQILEEVVRQEDAGLPAINELADCYQLAGNFNKSKFFYFMALQLAPKNRFCQMNYLNAVYKLKDWPAAIRLAHKAMEKDSTVALLSTLGDCYAQLEKRDSAIYYYSKAVKANAEDYNSLSKLARLYWQEAKYKEMVQVTERYIQTDSSNQQINQYNGIGHCLNKKYNRAIYRLNKLTEQGDSSFYTHFYLGTSYFANEDYVEAYEVLSKAYKKDSTNQHLFFFLGKSAIMSGHQEKGIYLLNKGIEAMTPKDSVLANFYYTISSGYNGLGDIPKEINALITCRKYSPQNRTLLYKIASIYYSQQKNAEEALNYYNQFMATRPKNTTTVNANSAPVVSYYFVAEKRIAEIKSEQEIRKKKR